MKKIGISILLIVSMFCSTCIGYALNSKIYEYNFTLHSYPNGTYIIGKNDNTLYIRDYTFNSRDTTTTYTLGKKVYAYSTYNEKIYAIYQSNKQENLINVAEISNNKVKDIFSFISKEINNSCKLAVDSKNNFYILNSNLEILIYDKTGNILTKTDSYHNMLSYNGKCFGIQYDKIQIITNTGVSKTYYLSNSTTVFTVSEKYIGRTPGEIYALGNNKLNKIMDIKIDTGKNPCETTDYIISIKEDTLLAYSKTSGNLIDQYPLNNSVYAVSSYKNNIIVLYKDFTVDKFLSNEIFKETPQKTNNNKNINLDNYIIVPQGTTAYSFKTNLYKDYIVKFDKDVTGQLGSNTPVKINGNTHTIVVKGDLTGEGNINSRDISAMFDHLLNINSLKKGYLYAGDLNNDGAITNNDLVLLSKLTK